MARPRIYSDDHFRLSTFRKNGRTYIYAYRNVWDAEIKQSRIAKREYVGTLNEITQEAKLGKTFLLNHPEYAGKTLFYVNRELVEKQPENAPSEVPETGPEEEGISPGALFAAESDPAEYPEWHEKDLEYGTGWALWQLAEQFDFLTDLKAAFGKEDGESLCALGIYLFLTDQAPMERYDSWVRGVWLPVRSPLPFPEINELLGRVTDELFTAYMKRRFDRVCNKENAAATQKFFAFSASAVRFGAAEKEFCACPEKNSEFVRLTYTLGTGAETGEVCFAQEAEVPVEDRTFCRSAFSEMKGCGFNPDEVLLISGPEGARSENIEALLAENVGFLMQVPLTEESVLKNLKKNYEGLHLPYLVDEEIGASYLTVTEERPQVCGKSGAAPAKTFLHLYYMPQIARTEWKVLNEKIQNALALKSAGSELKKKDWDLVSQYVTQDPSGKWTINSETLCEKSYITGCLAVRTDRLTDAKKALEICRRQNFTETAFRQFLNSNSSDGFDTPEVGSIGKLLVHTLAQSFGMIIRTGAFSSQTDELRIPEGFPSMLTDPLKKIRAVKGETQLYWVRDPINQKARAVLRLLGLQEPPKKFSDI